MSEELGKIKPQRLERLLAELAAISRRVASGEPLARPVVTLHLSSGRELRGALLDVSDEAGHSVALVAGGEDRFARDATHVPVAHLLAITVHDAARLLDRAGDAPTAPGKLELRRAFAALGDRMGVKLELPGSLELEGEREALSELLEPLRAALEGISADEMGKAALSRAEVIALKVADAPGARLENARLEVSTSRAFAGRPDATGLRALIEQAI